MHESGTHSSIKTVALVGVGLIGGSLAAALKSRGADAPTIIGVGRNGQRLEQACQANLLDRSTTDLTQAAGEADLIVFCTPVDLIVDGVRQAAPHCRPGTLITDAGSVKGEICTALADPLAEGVAFIGSHPLAGSHRRGFEHADPQLFEGRVCVVTPGPSAVAAEVRRLTEFWQSVGMNVLEMPPEAHDSVVAQTSHLPHLVACALVASLDGQNQPLAATGFQDTTRVAAGDPDVWLPIVLQNAEEILRSLDLFGEQLSAFKQAVKDRNPQALRALLQTAKNQRDQLDSRSS